MREKELNRSHHLFERDQQEESLDQDKENVEKEGRFKRMSKAPVIWSRVPETALPPRQLYRAFICETVVPAVGRVKVLPA